jgi:hypothetical protein
LGYADMDAKKGPPWPPVRTASSAYVFCMSLEALLDSSLQITVRRCDHPNVSAYWTRPADTFKLMLLQNTEERDLGLGWKFSDFIQEERTAIC